MSREETLLEIIRRQMLSQNSFYQPMGKMVIAITPDEFAELKRDGAIRSLPWSHNRPISDWTSIQIDGLWRFVPHDKGMSLREEWGVRVVWDTPPGKTPANHQERFYRGNGGQLYERGKPPMEHMVYPTSVEMVVEAANRLEKDNKNLRAMLDGLEQEGMDRNLNTY